MTTDTAVRVTRLVTLSKGGQCECKLIILNMHANHNPSSFLLTVPLEEIPYVDFPELRLNEHESTEMPFRYVKGEDGKPIMPEVRWGGCLTSGAGFECKH